MKTVTAMSADVTRTCYDRQNIYDGHHALKFEYRKNDKLMAITTARGYPHKNEFFIISTIRPPRAGRFSTGSIVAYFTSLDEMDEFIMSEIEKGIIKPYND